MKRQKPAPRRAEAGKCPACGAPTIRGLDQHGQLAETDRPNLDAAHELDATRYGRRVYVLAWRGHLELDQRTLADTTAHPAGYRPDLRVVREHRCPQEAPA